MTYGPTHDLGPAYAKDESTSTVRLPPLSVLYFFVPRLYLLSSPDEINPTSSVRRTSSTVKSIPDFLGFSTETLLTPVPLTRSVSFVVVVPELNKPFDIRSHFTVSSFPVYVGLSVRPEVCSQPLDVSDGFSTE